MSGMTKGQAQVPTLASVLHRANLRVVLTAVLLAGVSLFVLSMIALRFYMLDNLALSARSVAYAVEAAVVFGDRDAAAEALEQMVANRPVSVAYVFDRDGEEVVHWQAKESEGWVALEKLMASIFFARPAIEAIHHNGREIGTVELQSSGRDLAAFVLVALACGLITLILCGVVALRLSQRTSMEIVQPLRHLAVVTAAARRERRFGARVEPAAIAELRSLGDDFNALLAELASWQEQMRNHNATLAHQANHDPLTGLANRAHFEERLDQALDTMHNDGGHAALFFIDADRFKSINDEFGHEVGDIVLCIIARRLRAKVREGDLVARLGGDEFAVLLLPLGDLSQAKRIAGSMLESMAEPIELPSGISLNVSLSIGIAFFPDHATDAAGLLKKADEAMYESKRAGRGVYSVAPS
ncbi:diguanylate cyclase domain-containing protein [Azonexus sp.]|jgi:diguanylate cyclase (GGDEF)-like protein|uniref:diguanylate cyclase domain-containing protein n=1 Tax=Azonexus sp. TaxID=1872668 RepID=UPI00281D971C|nr:diguanylate cyclase [Azonexus sp.]MDR1996435.1 diguanylate cyclase [Azonexus sp.]